MKRNGFPAEILPYVAEGMVRDVSGHSEAATYETAAGYFIKTDEAGALENEYRMAVRFHEMGLGAEVMEYVSADRDYLVTRRLEGQDLTHFLQDPEKLCRMLADALHLLHGQKTDGIEISSRYQRYLDSYGGDINGGHYDESVLMSLYQIDSREQAWKMMQEGRYLLKCDTFIHGDACLPNLIQKDGIFRGFIDTAMAGVGDRHIDLYWAIWSLNYNLKTDAYTDCFLDMYGREYFDPHIMKVIAAFELFG